MTPRIAGDVFLAEGARVIGDVTLAEGANVWFNTVVRGDIQRVEVGKFTNLQDNVTVHVMSSEPTIIGDYVTVGHGAVIHCSRVGNNTLIGMGAVLLGHAVIGGNCIVGAGSVVMQRKKYPDNVLIYGNPARVIRDLREDEIKALHQSAVDYYDIALKYLKENDVKGVQ
ncbi:MAG: gamma carbonic anhydrase family protein [Schwartzia sp.]|nr:gamma carbonic anhydrase family protein [Schwartzia sp. (in: firmicutes)]